MSKNFTNGLMFGAGILLVVVVGIAVAVAADILTVDKDGTIRLRVSDAGKVTLNTSDAAEGDLRFTVRSSDPTAPLAGDLWYNDTVKEVKYADGGITKPLAEMTNADISLYVDGTNGNDNNNGLTSGTAKKTIQAAVNLIPPIVRHIVTVNIATGLYRDTGATVNGEDVCVYIANRTVTSGGVINLVGDETTPANVHVDGSNDGATPTRYEGFYINRVAAVNVKGVQCDYFKKYGIYYNNYAYGSPANSICSNNLYAGIYYGSYSSGYPSNCTCNNNGVGAGSGGSKAGIAYIFYSNGSPSNCTANGNGSAGFVFGNCSTSSPSGCTADNNVNQGFYYYTSSAGSPTNCSATNNTGSAGIYFSSNSTGSPNTCTLTGNSNGLVYNSASVGTPTNCTISSNTSRGIYVLNRSTASPQGCTISDNGSHAIFYSMNSGGSPGSSSANTGSNNAGYGIYGIQGSIVDYSGAGPTGTSGFTYEDAATYARVY